MVGNCGGERKCLQEGWTTDYFPSLSLVKGTTLSLTTYSNSSLRSMGIVVTGTRTSSVLPLVEDLVVSGR